MIIIARYTPNIYDTQNSHVSINLPFFHTIYLGVSVGTNKTLFFDEPVSQWTFLVGIEGYVTCQVQALGAWDWCARWNFVCSAIDIVQDSFMYSIYVYIQGYYVCWWCIVLNHISLCIYGFISLTYTCTLTLCYTDTENCALKPLHDFMASLCNMAATIRAHSNWN